MPGYGEALREAPPRRLCPVSPCLSLHPVSFPPPKTSHPWTSWLERGGSPGTWRGQRGGLAVTFLSICPQGLAVCFCCALLRHCHHGETPTPSPTSGTRPWVYLAPCVPPLGLYSGFLPCSGAPAASPRMAIVQRPYLSGLSSSLHSPSSRHSFPPEPLWIILDPMVHVPDSLPLGT